jgi:hypothetical protein
MVVQRDGKAAELAKKSWRQRFDLWRDGGRSVQSNDGNLQLFGQRGQARRAWPMKPRSTRILPSFSLLRSRWISSARARSSGVMSFPLDQDLAQAHLS